MMSVAASLFEELKIVHKITELVDDDTYVWVCQYIVQ
jgi:hypothetical protein